MKLKKKIIITSIVIIGLAILFGCYKVKTSYIYNDDETIIDVSNEIVESIKTIENLEERRKTIDFAVEHNMISQEQAQKLINEIQQ